MKKSNPSLTRRQALALAACVGASALLPQPATADEALAETEEELTVLEGGTEDVPPNPTGMITNIPDSGVQTFAAADPYWGTSSSGDKVFYTGHGAEYLNPAYKVIDVSEHQGTIDWNAVKSSGIDGAIIRLGYGDGSDGEGTDAQLANNISACNRLGIPYGLYLYSYAYNASLAASEARFALKLIKQYGCKPALPIFYDLEKWEWTGHTPPTSVNTYVGIVNSFCSVMSSGGYANVKVYSYRSYLTGGGAPLSSNTIWKRAAWVAEYESPTLQFSNPYYDGCTAWQYTSTGTVSGISTSVDISAFPPFYKLKFGDVTTKTDHYEDIWWLIQQGISEGFSDSSYRGMSSVTRQDMAAFLYRLAGSPSYTPSQEDMERFSDVTSSTPHYKEILWLGATGIAEGFEDGTYQGMEAVKRQDMAAFLYRFAIMFLDPSNSSWEPTSEDMARFPDVDESMDHAREVWWMGATGLSKGFDDGTFRGMDTVKRQDMAAFLHRAYDLKS